MKIITLSLTQPWATLVAIGAKQLETRSWSTSYNGPLAIHAAKGFPQWAKEFAEEDFLCSEALAAAGITGADQLPLGAIVAVCNLAQCIPTYLCPRLDPALYTLREKHFGDYSAGRYGWLLTDVVRLEEPMPACGSQRLWMPGDEVIDKLSALMEGR